MGRDKVFPGRKEISGGKGKDADSALGPAEPKELREAKGAEGAQPEALDGATALGQGCLLEDLNSGYFS